MTKFVPPGFNQARIIEGLHKAMGFGEPIAAKDKATFYLITRTGGTGPADDDGVGFDPTVRSESVARPVQVPCAIEYRDRASTQETFGDVTASRVEITLLDPDYQQIQGFSYVDIGEERYHYAKTLPPLALGGLGIWIIYVTAEDER